MGAHSYCGQLIHAGRSTFQGVYEPKALVFYASNSPNFIISFSPLVMSTKRNGRWAWKMLFFGSDKWTVHMRRTKKAKATIWDHPSKYKNMISLQR